MRGGLIAGRRDRDDSRHPLAAWVIRRAPEPIRPVVELLVRTAVDAVDDRVIGLSAEVAFFSILSLPPLLLTVVAALGFVPGDQTDVFVEGLVAASLRVFSQSTVQQIVEPTLTSVVESERIDVLSVAFAVAVFSASRAVRVVLTAVTIAYDLETDRPSWAQRLYGLLTTLALLVVVPIVLPLLLAGPDLGAQLTGYALVPAVTAQLWPWVYWGGIGLGAVVGVAGIYHLAAPWWTPFRRDVPGAVLAVLVWLGASEGLRTYAQQSVIGNEEVFGLLAGPLVMLVWLYVMAFGVILGAELNAELERLWPSPEQQRAPASERLSRRLLASPAATRLRETLPDLRPVREQDGDDTATPPPADHVHGDDSRVEDTTG